MKKIIIALFAICMTISAAFAQSITPNRGVVKDGYNFWFYNPVNGKSDTPKPVVIFLHGASLCGNDLNKVKRYGTIDAIQKGREIDAYVIAPQNPGGAWKPSKINAILEWAEKNYNVDSDRVYVLGMSLGGYGTIDMAAAFPEKIAAAMAFCGGGTTKNFDGLSQVPLWIVHGTADAAVPVSASDKVVAGIRATGDDSRLIYHRVPGMNHSRPARYFYLKESYEWLFSHSLKDHGRRINKQRAFDVAMLNNAYKDLGRNKKANNMVSAPAGHFTGSADDQMNAAMQVSIPTNAADRLMSEDLNSVANAMMMQNSSIIKGRKAAAEPMQAAQAAPATSVKATSAKATDHNTESKATEEKDWGHRRSLKARRNS